MKRPTTSRALMVPLVGAVVLALAACGSDAPAPTPETTGSPSIDADAPVTISVGDMPSTETPELRANFERRIEQFVEEYPHITVEPSETEWQADTFQALVAGGTLPTVLNVPFTEMGGLIARGQVADITDHLVESEVLSSLNPSVQEVTTDAEGRSYGVPVSAYTMGLLYHRGLFESAGLDPDDPPQTWEEVRAAAQTIDENTDAQGFQTMTLENTGGWILTTMSYSLGSTMQSEDGTTATLDNDATRQALEFYRTLRWDDDTLGSNFLVGYGDANNQFAAGRVGMYVQGADSFHNIVTTLGLDVDDFGVAPLPQGPDGLGTLGGGSVRIISPRATPEQISAALTWIEFMFFEAYSDEAVARAEAETAVADGLPVGHPVLPVVSAELSEQRLAWTSDLVNVPRENWELYLSTVQELPLVPEPAVKAQEMYALLDPVVQAVLTREDADIDQLLADAQASAQAAIDAG